MAFHRFILQVKFLLLLDLVLKLQIDRLQDLEISMSFSTFFRLQRIDPTTHRCPMTSAFLQADVFNL
jgi:hypothetical protein